jgi:hypothetical protein
MASKSTTMMSIVMKSLVYDEINNPVNRMNQQTINESIEDLRQQYCNIFDEQNTLHCNDQNWWIEQFNIMATTLSKDLITDHNTNYLSCSIAYNNKLMSFNKRMILIGRMPGCDIELYQYGGLVSRLHAIIFFAPEIDKIIVIDVGSLTGIKTFKRSTKNNLESSLPNNRKVLVFEYNESFILDFNNLAKVIINPKECIICMEKPRNCLFNCKHYSVCYKCSKKIKECPICRKVITRVKRSVLALTTHVC